MRTILLIGVLASLCFSVGEGLRLLPLPQLPARPCDSADTRPRATSPVASAQSQYMAGSLGAPPQGQQILKRKQAQLALPPRYLLPLPNRLRHFSGAQWRAGSRLAASVSRPPGRAPPRAA